MAQFYTRFLIAAAIFLTTWSCSTFPEEELYIDRFNDNRTPSDTYPERESGKTRDKVFIMYSMGYNNLSYDLNEDIDELLKGSVPSFNPSDNAIVIFNHSTLNNRSNYRTETSPVLYHAYKMADGSIKKDTLIVYPEGSIAADKEMLREVLTQIKTMFPAKSYGMLVSSHATGWAPEMYCYSPPDKAYSSHWASAKKEFQPLDKYTDERPLTRSIGAHFNGSSANMDEIELQDFADEIPFHLDFMIFDCCLMGGVEVAYELRNICDKVCFSQTEILAGGMNYKKMIHHIFRPEVFGGVHTEFYQFSKGVQIIVSAKEKAVKAPKVDKKTAKKIAEKKSSANKLRDLTNEQLVKKIDDLKQEIFNLRFQAAVGKLENTAGLRKAKKDVARCYTILTERKNAQGN